MKTIFDPAVRKDLIERSNRITSQSERKWGSMRPDQGLHHINNAFQLYLGEITAPYQGNDFIAALARLFVFSPIPIPKGKTKTAAELVAADTYDLSAEKQHFAELINRIAAAAGTRKWPVHAFFGKLSEEQYGKLGYKHTDHHLKQFGV